MNIQDLSVISYSIACEKGWWDEKTPGDGRYLEDLIMLMVSEVSEAVEDYRKHHAPTEMWFERKLPDGSIELRKDQEVPTDKPCGIPSELADVVIRVADLVGRLDDPKVTNPFGVVQVVWPVFTESVLDGLEPLQSTLMAGLYRVTFCVMCSMQEDEYGNLLPSPYIRAHLKQTVRLTFALAQQFGIDLMGAIEMKTAYNRTRPYRHGDKKI